MDHSWKEERHAVLQAAKEMVRRGLVTGTAGNVSARLPALDGRNLYLITPAAKSYETMTENDLVVVDDEVEPQDGEKVPSSESLLHLAVYQRRCDVRAIMHTHSVFASVAAVTGRPIPPVVDELVVYVGGQVEVAEYGMPSSQRLADNAAKALGDRKAVILRHHGLSAVGSSAQEALEICSLVERVAQIYFYAALSGMAATLPSEVVASEQEIYRMRSGIQKPFETGPTA